MQQQKTQRSVFLQYLGRFVMYTENHKKTWVLGYTKTNKYILVCYLNDYSSHASLCY